MLHTLDQAGDLRFPFSGPCGDGVWIGTAVVQLTAIDRGPRLPVVGMVGVDVVGQPRTEHAIAHPHHQHLGGDLRLRGPFWMLDQLAAHSQRLAQPLVVVDVGEVGKAPAEILFAAEVAQIHRLLPAPVFLGRGEITRFVLRRGQHVGNLPMVGNAVVDAGTHDHLDRLVPGQAEACPTFSIAFAHPSALQFRNASVRRGKTYFSRSDSVGASPLQVS
ncbi:hypothetical protein VL23_00115 [Stenotrophomonas maltophilia]|uniref:Uncharacterized protein n=1 Tax=Stenotrophomonas maltophilia TaxID=40324 RepID=A0AB34TFN0_STEMA|nr:hypothetical protein VL23_00115 [Stenotrophomonas maltophilia]